MKERDWRTLVHSMSHGDCIVVVGPETPFPLIDDDGAQNGPERGRPQPLATQLATRLSEELGDSNPDRTSLSHVAELYQRDHHRNTLEVEAQAFYEQVRDKGSGLYRELAALPVSLFVSLTHDDGLVTALREAGKTPIVEVYDFHGDRKANVGVGSRQSPLVYYLFGHMSSPPSLVLTENDIVEFLVQVVSKRKLPDDVVSQLASLRKSFLLLGCGLTKWYLRLLLHILKFDRRHSKSFALEKLPHEPEIVGKSELQRTIFFMKTGLGVESFDCEVEDFVRELRTRVGDTDDLPGVDAKGAPKAADAPLIFISYTRADAQEVGKLSKMLQSAGFAVWYDTKSLKGGDDWAQMIRKQIKEADYVIVVQSTALAQRDESWLFEEVKIALDRQRKMRSDRRFLIPLQINPCALLDELSDYQTIALHKEDGLHRLVEAIKQDQERRRGQA